MVHIIILAGGKGTRMRSDRAKVLTPVKGLPIITRLLDSLAEVCKKPTLVIGYKGEDVRVATGNNYHYVMQKEQLGTGHAVMMAKEALAKEKDIKTVVVLAGDHPLVSAETIQKLIERHEKEKATITLATAEVPNFEHRNSVFLHYGRVIRDPDGTVHKIVEFKDATEDERAITEVNPGYYCFDAAWLWKNISKLQNINAASEFYLTDMIQIARDEGNKIVASDIKNSDECLGINTPEQLALVEEAITD